MSRYWRFSVVAFFLSLAVLVAGGEDARGNSQAGSGASETGAAAGESSAKEDEKDAEDGAEKAKPDPLAGAKSLLRARQFAAAIKALDEVLQKADAAEATKGADEAIYLKALAQFHNKQPDKAAATCEKLIAGHKDSSWLRKARFLKAKALIAQREFKAAEVIYEEEASRLLSEKRKHEIAGVIIGFAEALAREPDPNDVGAPPPNYTKAYNLYGKALEMEIGRELKDQVMYERAVTILKQKNFNQAIADFRAYLAEFDPDWTGEVGSVTRMSGRKRENPKPAGMQILAARFHLTEAQIKGNQHGAARVNAEDLLSALEQLPEGKRPQDFDQLKANTAWLLVQSYRMPTPTADELDKAVQVTRKFLAEHPDHPRSVQAASMIAIAYQQHGRADRAIAAYEKLIAGEGFKLPQGDLATDKLEDLASSPAEHLDMWRKLGLYRIGQIRFGQKQYDKAIERWSRYINQYPNGPQWADCQRGVINAEFQVAVDAVAEKDYPRGRQLFEQFLAKHPLDGRARQILFVFGQIEYVAAEDLASGKSAEGDGAPVKKVHAAYQKAIDRWQRLVTKYPNTEESSLALYRIGLIYEEKLGDLDKALDSYRRLTWGSSAGQAKARVAVMTQKHLQVKTPKKFRGNEKVTVRLDTRNVKKLVFKQYFLDLEAYFRKTHEIGRVDALDIDLIQPDKTWEVAIDDYAKYKPITQQVEIPYDKHKAGVCLVNVSDEDLEATTLVVRSDLDLIVKSSRRELLVFVQNMAQNAPAKNVELLVSDGEKVFATGKTGEDGVFRGEFDELKSLKTARVFAMHSGSVASNLLNLERLTFSQGLSAKGYLYTDRPAYQPGQTVKFRGILRNVKDGAYVAPAGDKYDVSILDSSGRLLWEIPVTLSPFGTLSAEFRLDGGSPLGTYQLVARKAIDKKDPDAAAKRPTYSSTFEVQRFKLEKMKLALEADRKVYFRGEKVKLTIEAQYYWGQPVANKPIRCTLPDGRTVVENTDAEGKLKIEFDTSGMQPGTPLGFSATIEGENVAAAHVAFLASQGFNVAVKPSRPLAISGEPFDVEIKTTTPDNKPVGRDLTLTVLRRAAAKSDKVLDGVPWIAAPQQAAEEITVMEKKITTDEKTGVATVNLHGKELEPGGQYILRVSGEDRFKQVVTGQSQVEISDDRDSVKLRWFAKTDTLQVGAEAKLRLHSRVDAKLALLTIEGETIISYRILPLEKGYNAVELPIGHEHFPNFRVAVSLMDGMHLRSAYKALKVERQLNVAVKPLREAYQPGATGKVELTITDQLGKAVRGELSLALVDEALFAMFPDTGPNIREFFQKDAYRHAEFREASTCGFLFTAKTRQVRKAYTDEKQRLARQEEEAKRVAELGTELRMSRSLAAQAVPPPQAPTSAPARPLSSRDRWRSVEGASGQVQAVENNLSLVASQTEAAAPSDDKPALNGASVPGRAIRYYTLADGRKVAIAGDKFFSDRDGNGRLGMHGAFAGDNFGYGGGGFGGVSGRFSADLSFPQPRQELPEAGWWAGSIVTDETGKATVEVPMPETTTQWRLTARGVTVETLVGQATANVLTRKDFFVAVKAPRLVRQGDSLGVIARAHNLTDFEGEVKLELTVLGGEDMKSQLARRTLSVKIDKQGVAEVVFDRIEIPSASQLKIQVQATAGELADAVAINMPVRPWGLEFAAQTGGTATGDAAAQIELPGGRKYESRWMTISVGPNVERSVIQMALGASPARPLVASDVVRCIYPPPPGWGRTPGSDLLAVVSALRYAQAVQAPREDIERLTQRVRSLVSALVVSQREDGGWNWTGPSNKADWSISAMSYWALAEAKDLGVAVHDDTLKKAEVHLNNQFTQLSQNDNDAKAVILHALSCRDKADFANVNRLHRERNTLSAPALAYTALAFVNLKRNEFAAEMLATLESKAKTAGERSYWDGSSKHPILDEPIEATAVAALALMRAKPNSDRIGPAVQYLLGRQGVWGFTPAKAHGPAVAALCRYYQEGKYAANDYRLTVLVNGKEVQTLTSRDAESLTLLSVPAEVVAEGKNRIEFRLEGRGRYTYAVSMRGFTSDLKDPESWRYPYVRNRYYRHAQLEYKGRPIGVDSTSPVEHVEVGQRVKVYVDVNEYMQESAYLVVEEYLPAGMMVVDGSLQGRFKHHEVQGDRIVMYYPPGESVRDYSYELIGYASGSYRTLPTVIRDSIRPDRMRIGKPADLAVLKPGEKSDDPYKMNDAERFALGKLYFDDGRYAQAVEHLAYLFKNNRRYNEREVARMLLWIYTSEGLYDAQQIVDVFESLRERFPTLSIPFDKILIVGRAYRDIGEWERAYQVFRATIDASFINDSNVSAVLEDEGQFLGSVDYQEDLWREYPDTAEVASAFFALSQAIYEKAPEAHEIAKQERQIALKRGKEAPDRKPDKISMLKETIRLLTEYLTLYPESPLADDAAFSMANVYLDLKQYPTVVELSDVYRRRFDKSEYASGFQYMIALGHFWQRQHDQALEAAKIVAEGKSKDRDFARYIVGQIFHAKNQPAEAIDWYRKVASQYADAQQAIDYFQEKHIALDEVTIVRPGKPVELKIDYRNIADARCQVYRVDLMKLYLREKNLSSITKVNLAGIQPLVDKVIKLGDGKDYVDKEHKTKLELKDEGAYLVICRGDDLFTSGLVLITPLRIEVQEDAVSGRVRANVINEDTGDYEAEVHVKAIGSADTEFRSGETDLRGIYVADNIRGKATVIARAGDARYAFYRGETHLGPPDELNQPAEQAKEAPASAGKNVEYEFNIKMQNEAIQKGNRERYDLQRRSKPAGVQIQEAY